MRMPALRNRSTEPTMSSLPVVRNTGNHHVSGLQGGKKETQTTSDQRIGVLGGHGGGAGGQRARNTEDRVRA